MLNLPSTVGAPDVASEEHRPSGRSAELRRLVAESTALRVSSRELLRRAAELRQRSADLLNNCARYTPSNRSNSDRITS